MAFDKRADIVFDVLTIISFVVFSSEILMAVIIRPRYIFSFFFFLDFISTISLIMDI
jgi:hypothetical protein